MMPRCPRAYPLDSHALGSIGARVCLLILGIVPALAGCEGDPLTLTPTAVSNAVSGVFYQQLFDSDGDDVSWEVAGGALPAGLILNGDTGRLSGTPTQTGDFEFTLSAVQLGLQVRSGERSYSMTVQPRLTLGDELPLARIGEPYEFTLEVAGGVPPYTFTMIGLPGGIEFDQETGVLSGMPVAPDPGRSVQASVTDSGSPQQTVTENYVLIIKPEAVEITTTVLSAGTKGMPYSFEVEAEGGFDPYTWTIVEGTLPPGLALPADRETGLISGTPTQEGTFTFTIEVEDSDDPASVDTQELFIVIAP